MLLIDNSHGERAASCKRKRGKKEPHEFRSDAAEIPF